MTTQTMPFRIFGSEMSPYSVKVRSYFRYKGIPHQWIVRNASNQAEYQKYAKLPLIPLVVTPDGEGIQDSTPIIERVEAAYPEPSIHPADPVAAFVSALLEEFGDEWGNKWMFHYRWARDVDQMSSAGSHRAANGAARGPEQHAATTAQIRARMVDRVWFVGSNEKTAPQIEASFEAAIDLLETHLATRPYLFGARPAFGDFGLWGQLYGAWTDPTAGRADRRPRAALLAWIHRMLWPRAEGEFETVVEPRRRRCCRCSRRRSGGCSCPGASRTPRAIAAGERVVQRRARRPRRGRRSRRSTTPGRSRRCARSMRRSPTSARSTPCSIVPAAARRSVRRADSRRACHPDRRLDHRVVAHRGSACGGSSRRQRARLHANADRDRADRQVHPIRRSISRAATRPRRAVSSANFRPTIPTSRATGVAAANFVKEVAFYRELKSTGSRSTRRVATTPQIDGVGPDFALLLEDLRAGERRAINSPDARRCRARGGAELVGLHAPSWCDASLRGIDWLGEPNAASAEMLRMLYRATCRDFWIATGPARAGRDRDHRGRGATRRARRSALHIARSR